MFLFIGALDQDNPYELLSILQIQYFKQNTKGINAVQLFSVKKYIICR